MARWTVVTERPSVPVWLVADRVVGQTELAGSRVQWIVEMPFGAESMLQMVRGVLSVTPFPLLRRSRVAHVDARSKSSTVAFLAAGAKPERTSFLASE